MRNDSIGREYDIKKQIRKMKTWPPPLIKAYINLFGLASDEAIGPENIFAILQDLYVTTWEGMEKYRLLRHVDDIS